MLGEMIKKEGRARFYFSRIFSCILYFLEKILSVKLKNLYTSACLNLNMVPANSNQKWWDLSKLVTNTLTKGFESET